MRRIADPLRGVANLQLRRETEVSTEENSRSLGGIANLRLRRETEASTEENSRSLEGDSTSLPEERDNIFNQVKLPNQMMTCKKVEE